MSMVAQKPVEQKPPREAKDAAYLVEVRKLPCCVCVAFGLAQIGGSFSHHVFHDRFSGKRTPDKMAIPLCDAHHQGDWDTGKIAIHRNKALWRAEYGPDYGFTATTQDMILENEDGR